MRLRRGQLADMAPLARLYRETVRASLPFVPERHGPSEDVSSFAERLFPSLEFWVGEDAWLRPMGYIAFRPDFIEHLFLAPAHQGRGLGARLLGKAMENAEELSLWTFQQNLRARRFYERHGFVAVLETDGLDNQEQIPDVLYRWRRTGRTS
ncbi:MAG: GNAT family N-acetyltransferase [Caulobacteraceae bacterium]|nr:GNAT family N-acetyltransferase [Caulobacteraceae bacterium]